jgi:hypothetical protein
MAWSLEGDEAELLLAVLVGLEAEESMISSFNTLIMLSLPVTRLVCCTCKVSFNLAMCDIAALRSASLETVSNPRFGAARKETLKVANRQYPHSLHR